MEEIGELEEIGYFHIRCFLCVPKIFTFREWGFSSL